MNNKTVTFGCKHSLIHCLCTQFSKPFKYIEVYFQFKAFTRGRSLFHHRRVNVSYDVLYFNGIFSSHIFCGSARTIDRCKLKFFTPQKTQIYAAFLSSHTFSLDLSDKGIYISGTNKICTKENSFRKFKIIILCQYNLFWFTFSLSKAYYIILFSYNWITYLNKV